MQVTQTHSSVVTIPPVRQLLLGSVLSLSTLLVACGGDNNPSQRVDLSPPPAPQDELAGRLAIYDADAMSVKLFSIEDERFVGEFSVPGSVPALYASPDYRYGLVVQRSDNRVLFIDSGVYSEDHGNHIHDYAEPPALLNFQLDVPRPTHYTLAEGTGVIFNDGNTGIVATVSVISDASIASGSILANLETSNNQHGVAKLVGDQLFVTHRDASIVSTTLPSEVDRYHLDGTELHFAERYELQCPLLHGAANNRDFLLFGCGDGLLMIDLNDPDYAASKLANPGFLAEGARIGTLVSHPDIDAIVGIAGDQMLLIDPQSEEPYQPLTLPDGAKRLAQGFDAHGESFYVLSDAGNLHIFSPELEWGLLASVAVTAALSEGAPAPAVTVSQSEDRFYILDPTARSIVVVDSLTGEVISTIALDFTATRIAWLGFVGGGDLHNH